MKDNWLIRGARVIDPANNLDAAVDVLIQAGKIACIGETPTNSNVPTIEANGLVLTPGFVDLHCHLREPGFEYKETIATGTRAAVRGGFTTVCSMANTDPVVDTPATVAFILQRAREAAAARVYPLAAVTQGFGGTQLVEMAALAEAGAVAFSDDGMPIADARMMRHALEYSLLVDKPIVNHCEDPSLAHGGVMHEGLTSLRLGLRGMPAEAEETMVARDALLARRTGAHVHIAHVSTQGSVEIIRAAKQRGIRITAEVTPHHLTLTDSLVAGAQPPQERARLAYDTSAKVNPPLRTSADIDALIEGLNDGTLDAIATDHAPHSTTDKLCEYSEAASGISCLETAFSQVYQLVQEGRVSLQSLVSKLTIEPSRVFGLSTGTLTVGAPADIAVLDLHDTWTVDPDTFASKGKNTPIAGATLPGKVAMTFVDGRLVNAEEPYSQRRAQ
jgi:dihydroorotase